MTVFENEEFCRHNQRIYKNKAINVLKETEKCFPDINSISPNVCPLFKVSQKCNQPLLPSPEELYAFV